MKTNCDIIRDLLPLYVEGIASEASKQLVNEHLAECPACKEELARMKKPLPVRPELKSAEALQKLRRAVNNRKIRAVLITCLLTVLLLGGVYSLYNYEEVVPFDEVEVYASYEQAICETPSGEILDTTDYYYIYTVEGERVHLRYVNIAGNVPSYYIVAPVRVTRFHEWINSWLGEQNPYYINHGISDTNLHFMLRCKDCAVYYSEGEVYRIVGQTNG